MEIRYAATVEMKVKKVKVTLGNADAENQNLVRVEERCPSYCESNEKLEDGKEIENMTN